MLTIGILRKTPARFKELGNADVLLTTASAREVVIDRKSAGPKKADTTEIFAHETISMMRAERASQLDAFRKLIGDNWTLIPLVKKSHGFWEHITLGRASTTDIALDDPAISNAHAEFIRSESGVLTIQDVGSSNGTFVNRVGLNPHHPQSLRTGDCVRVGQTVFYYATSDSLEEMLTK